MDRFDHDGLGFDVSDSGPVDGRPVVLLHGFPADRTSWDEVTPALVADGHRVLAPDQRGYSPDARPPRRRDYRLGLLAADVVALADAAGSSGSTSWATTGVRSWPCTSEPTTPTGCGPSPRWRARIRARGGGR